MSIEDAAARIERAMDEYEEALFQETRMRLRVLQRDFFPGSVVEFRDCGYRMVCVEIMIDGRSARGDWCGDEQARRPGFREAVALEDWHEERALDWNTRIKDIRLEARR